MTRPRLAAGGVSGRANPARWADLHIARGTAAMSVQSVLYEPVRAGRAHNTELELTQVSTFVITNIMFVITIFYIFFSQYLRFFNCKSIYTSLCVSNISNANKLY